MTEERPQPNGSPGWRPGLPGGVLVAAILVALLAVSGLIYLLYNRTVGPAEVLREFAENLDAGDCVAAYDLLDERSRGAVSEEEFCAADVPRLDEELDADFTLDRVVYHRQTQTADVTVVGREDPWRLKRDGNSWRVVVTAGG